MSPTIVKTILAALASTFFGISYTAPKPWCFYSVGASSICVAILRLLP